MSDLNTQLVFGANTAGAEAGVRTVKRSLKELSDTAASAGKSIEGVGDRAGKSLAGMGDGAEVAARKIQRDTNAMRGSLQRYLASLESGSKDSRRYWETMADFKGIDKNALQPLLSQLDAYNAKTKDATESTVSWTGGLSRIGAGVAGVAAITATVGVAAKAMFDASVSAERLRTMLDFSTGGNSAKEIEYLRGITYRLGLEFASTAKAYSQFSAAAKGTALEGDKARAVFESVAKASSVMGLSAADTSGVLLALQQMISKGTVQAEELRGQLGERLPGAFQIAAKAMGVTTGELGKMLEQGQVIADDFLPKFAAALDKNLGGAAEKAANRLDASVNRLATSWDRLKQNSGDSGVSSFMAGQYEILADGFNGLSEAMERARGSGSGFIGQMAAGAVAAAKFANPLQAVSYSAIETGNALKQAEAEFAALQKRGDVMGGNIYYKAEMANLAALIKELKAAQAEKQKLATGAAPNMNEGVTASGRAREQYNNQRAKDEEAANAFRLKQSGVPESYVKEMTELIRLNQAGVITGKEYDAQLKAMQDTLLKKTGVTKASNTAANQEQNTYESLIASIRAKIEEDKLELAGGAALTESQRLRIKLDQDLLSGKIKLGSAREAEVRALIEEKAASEAQVTARRALNKANIEAGQTREKYLASLETGIGKIRDDIAAQQEATARMGLSKEAIADLDAAKLEMLATDLELQAIKAMDRNLDQATYDALKEQAKLYRDLAVAKKGGAAKETALDLEKANEQAAKKAQEDWERAAEDINRSLTDALLRGFESGKGFAENLRDTLKNMFNTLVLRPIISAVLSPVSGAIQGLVGGAGGMTGGGGGGVIGMASNAYSLGNGAYSLYNGSFGGTMIGQAYAGYTGATLAPGMVGPSMTAITPASQIGGYFGGGSSAGMGGMGAFGIYAVIAALLANAFGAFGDRVEVGTGLQGTLGKGDLNSYSLMRESGTLFGGPDYDLLNPADLIKQKKEELAKYVASTGGVGDATSYSIEKQIRDLEETYGASIEFAKAQSKAIQTSYELLRTNVGDMADVLGLSSDAVRGFTMSLTEGLVGGNGTIADTGGQGFKLQGLTAEEISKKINEALATANNTLAEQVIGRWEAYTETLTSTTQELIGTGENADYVFNTITETTNGMRYVASEYARENEKAIDTLTRLATSLVSVNTVFDALGVTMLSASLSSADFASSLIDTFGGGERFGAMTSSFYDKYYSDEEKRANKQKVLDKGFSELGIEQPKTKEEFRKLVTDSLDEAAKQDAAGKAVKESIAKGFSGMSAADLGNLSIGDLDPALYGGGVADPANAGKLNAFLDGIKDLSDDGLNPEAFDKGVAGLVEINAEILGIGKDAGKTAAGLLALSDTFSELNESADETAARVAKEQSDARDAAYRGLERAIAKEKEALQSQIDIAQDVASTMGDLFDLLHDNVRELYAEVDSTRGFQAEQGNQFIAQALAAARTSGYLPDADQLAEAIGAARTGIDSGAYTSQFAQDRDRLVLAGRLAGLEDLTEKQLTDAQRTVQELEDQTEQLDKTLDYWKEQIDIANGTYEATLSVADAIKSLESKMFPELGVTKPDKIGGGAAAPGEGFSAGGGGGGGGGTPFAVLDYETGVRKYRDGSTQQLTPAELEQAKAVREWQRSVGIIPAFAVGTNYVPRDMLAQIHEGEAIIPKAYNPAANPGMSGGNGELVAAVNRLAEQNAALASRLEAIEGNTRPMPQMARQIDTYTNGGNFSRQKALA